MSVRTLYREGIRELVDFFHLAIKHYVTCQDDNTLVFRFLSMFDFSKIFDLSKILLTVTRKFPVNSNGLHGEVDVQLSPFGLLLLTQPFHSSEQH